jgi:hypothetical protein
MTRRAFGAASELLGYICAVPHMSKDAAEIHTGQLTLI